MTEYEPVIGLEIHAELLTQSKMFCGCAVVDSIDAPPNSSTCEICLGLPGSLPVVNRRAVEYAIRVALALNCTVSETSVYARKNYFYPDLPKGYQISQYELPLATDGWVDLDGRRIRIRRVHLEEDTGKLFHRGDYSLVDYNRSGVPLLEIVTEPDLRSAEEARRFGLELRSLLRYLGVNTGDMQKGVMRFEANVSVRPAGSDEFGTRTEIKNLNSFRALTRAAEFELARQEQVLREGGEVVQDTIGWDETSETAFSQRGKEEAHDYRYFAEPDLPRLVVEAQWVEEIGAALPELPSAKRVRFVKQYELSEYDVELLTGDAAVADYFEEAVAAARAAGPKKVANWITGELFGRLNEASLEIVDARVTAAAMAELVDMVEGGTISAVSGKEVLEELFANGGSPTEIVESRELAQMSDTGQLRDWIEQVISDNPDELEAYLGGKETLSQWFFGQVMRASQGKADPQALQRELEAALQEKAQAAR